MQVQTRTIGAVAALAIALLIAIAPAHAGGEPQLPVAPAGAKEVNPGEPLDIKSGQDSIQPVSGEVKSATSSDPSVVTVDANYSNMTGTWSLDYQCKKAGVAVVTIVLANGTKTFQIVGCDVRWGLMPVDIKGRVHPYSLTAWVEKNGTLVVKGYTKEVNGTDVTTKPLDISVAGYSPANTSVSSVPPKAPIPGIKDND